MNQENKEAEIVDITGQPHSEEELDMEKVEAKLTDYKGDFEKFYRIVKQYKGRGLDLWQIRGQNAPLQEVITGWQDILADGGIIDARHASKLFDSLKELADNSETKDDFWRRAFDAGKMKTNSDLHNFFKAFTAGAAKRHEAAREAA